MWKMKITLISFKMRESSLGTPVGKDEAVLSSFSVLPELLKIGCIRLDITSWGRVQKKSFKTPSLIQLCLSEMQHTPYDYSS